MTRNHNQQILSHTVFNVWLSCYLNYILNKLTGNRLRLNYSQLMWVMLTLSKVKWVKRLNIRNYVVSLMKINLLFRRIIFCFIDITNRDIYIINYMGWRPLAEDHWSIRFIPYMHRQIWACAISVSIETSGLLENLHCLTSILCVSQSMCDSSM